MVSGWLKNSLRQKREEDDSKFEWNDEDQGTINGNIIELKEILEDSPFKNFKIETEINYKWRSCNQAFQEPCPYYITAVVSMVAPIGPAMKSNRTCSSLAANFHASASSPCRFGLMLSLQLGLVASSSVVPVRLSSRCWCV